MKKTISETTKSLLRRCTSWLDKASPVGRIAVIIALVLFASAGAATMTSCKEAAVQSTETGVRRIAFGTVSINDASQDQGSSRYRTVGVNGEEKVTYRVSKECNKETSRQTVKEVVLKQPVTEEILVGTRHTVIETAAVPFGHQEVNDNSLGGGQKKLQTSGANGIKTLTYQISQDEGQPEQKILVKEEVTTAPVDEVYGVGPQCDPNYTGACVPNVPGSDVDCGNGRGNGPYYVYGTVRVVGIDRYGLDGNHNGYGCE